MMKVRMRIVDLRGREPVIVFETYIRNNQMIPKRKGLIDYKTQGWKKHNYQHTPIGKAHNQLITDVVEKVQRTISGVSGA